MKIFKVALVLMILAGGEIVFADLLTPLERYKIEQAEKRESDRFDEEIKRLLASSGDVISPKEVRAFERETERAAKDNPFNYILLAGWRHKEKNYDKARAYYHKAIESRNLNSASIAALRLGEMAMNGEGNPPDKDLAMKYFKELSFTHGKGAYYYALGCLEGDGVEYDYGQGIEILEEIYTRRNEDKGVWHSLPYPNAADSIVERNRLIPQSFTKDLWEEIVSLPNDASGLNLFYAALCSYVGKFEPKNARQCYEFLDVASQRQESGAVELLRREYKTLCEFGVKSCVNAPFLFALNEKDGRRTGNSYVHYLSISAKDPTSGAQDYYQFLLAEAYYVGAYVRRDCDKAIEYYKQSALAGSVSAQYDLATIYASGDGVIRNEFEAYKWLLLAGKNGESVSEELEVLERKLTREEIHLARSFAADPISFSDTPSKVRGSESDQAFTSNIAPSGYGSGLLVKGGYVLTCWHVVDGAERISISLAGKDHLSSIVQKDVANDIAVLKVGDAKGGVTLNLSDDVKLGEKIFTLGYPHPDLQGSNVKFTTGSISSLTGIDNSPRYFQISAPLQSGNSGGPLFDEHGNLVGIVAAKLDSLATLAMTGDLPQNVNYAIKADYLVPLLKTVEGLEVGKEKTKDVNLLGLIEELKKSVVMIKVY